LARIISGLLITILALIDSLVKIKSSIDPTMIPLYVTGDFFDSPLALLKFAKMNQSFEDNLIPLNQKEKDVKIISPPIKEKPTIASLRLLRIIIKFLLVA